ncbi:MAG TPA: hypothetical protein DCX65_10995 [Spirochaetaceae bacterium]|nr:hypothetical protein [Spirochaetaceae bacterium]
MSAMKQLLLSTRPARHVAFSLLALGLALTGCRSAGQLQHLAAPNLAPAPGSVQASTTQPDAATSASQAAARPVATLVYVWEHSIVYHQPGTRSEGRSHYLTCNGTLLPDVFALVVLPDGRSFAFGTRSQLWGDDGYVPADLVKLPASPTAITSNSLAVGFYLGDSRLAGTPAGWFHARRDGWQAFIDPTRVDAFVQANRLEPLPRQRQAELAPSAKP